MSKEHKVLLVLGASSDIGRKLLPEVCSQYDAVLCHYRTDDSFLSAIREEERSKVRAYQADFSDFSSTEKFIRSIQDTGYFPDHIVHLIADYAIPCKFVKESWDTFGKAIRIALHSAVEVLRAFLPAMQRQKYGKIIFMLSSYVNGTPPKYLSAYTTVKYALLGLMKSLAVEYADKGITFNGISPEMIETKFLRNLSEYIVLQNAEQSPRKRNLTVEEVIPSVLFLLSDGSDSITGQNIVITGGK